ncbi:MAG: DUF975 family protein [Bacteroidaceae bacterium]|nr:DUF975 family protein [Bacteroidaceae bacterium]
MKTSSDYRAAGRADLSGRWLEAAMLTFVFCIISGIFSATFVGAFNLWLPGVGSACTLLLIPMAWSFTVVFLTNRRREDSDPFDIGHLFDGYRNGQFLRIFTTILLEGIYIFLWCLLFIIPGIIKAFSYSMTTYILRDYPELKNNAAIELSMDMMQGHKADLFWLYLTFIGWGILCLLTLGIGFFWLEPYMEASIANFYEDVKAEYEMRNGIEPEPAPLETDNYQKEEYR